jgi:hypothetical protein
LLLAVSVTVSAERKAGFCTPVSASKISVPRSSGDRFDDWVVGPQFEPYCLHHAVLELRLSSAFSVTEQNGDFCTRMCLCERSPVSKKAAFVRLSPRP